MTKMPKQISVLIKPASSGCNLRCRYCFYADISEQREVRNYGIMSLETMHHIVDKIAQELNEEGIANISFQGGEPTLAGLSYFQDFVAAFRQYPKIDVHYSLQTNGVLIDEAWAAFFKENHFLLGVSLDGYETNMDLFRMDTKEKSVFYRVLNAIDLLKKYGVEYNILTVVTKQLAKHPRALFDFYKSHKFEYVQLIPCLPSLGETEDLYSLTPESYKSFFLGFFDAWHESYQKGHFISVNTFENIAGMLQGYPPYQCGMIGQCHVHYVIESNGYVYPCDFYCLDEYLLGNINEDSFDTLRTSKAAQHFLLGQVCEKKVCQSCKYRKICHGSCRRMNVCFLEEESCSYQALLDHMIQNMNQRRTV